MSHPWDGRVLPPLRRHLADGGWQIVHTHGMRANLPVRLVLPTLPRRPLLFTTVHSDLALDYSDPARARGYAVIDRLTRRAVDGFCCVSADLAGRLAKSGVPRSKIHVVHPGIELSGIGSPPAAAPGESSAGPTATPSVRATTNAASAAAGPVVGTVARLVGVKDLGLLLDTAQLLRTTVTAVHVTIVGEGPERSRLESYAAEKDLEGTAEFLGQVSPVWPALARFDVFAMTSEYEGLPISVLEAMAAGLPVVATAVGGLSEVVEDGVSGFLVPREPDRAATAAVLAARIGELLLDRGLRERMGAAGRSRVTECFSADAAGRTMSRVYERELAAGGRAACRGKG